MIYLDYGATSFHKPPAVYRAVELAMRRGSHWRRAGLLQWSSPVFIQGAAIRCLVPRMQAGMPRQDRRRHDSGTPWKERIFRP